MFLVVLALLLTFKPNSNRKAQKNENVSLYELLRLGRSMFSWRERTFCSKSHDIFPLKGSKHEIFSSGVFTQIRPVRVGDLGTTPKNPKFWWFRLEIFILLALFLGRTLPKLKWMRGLYSKWIWESWANEALLILQRPKEAIIHVVPTRKSNIKVLPASHSGLKVSVKNECGTLVTF
jgi:hypothetical protein